MTKRKDGRLQEVLIVNGKPKYFYGKTKAEVLNKIAQFKEEQEKGRNFDKIADEWWAEHEPTIEYNSTRNYKPALERAKKQFEGVPIKEILPVQIASHVTEFAKTHAQKTVDTQLMIYRSIYTYAVNKGDCIFNAAKDIKVKAKKPSKKRKMPENEIIKKILKSSDCTFGLYTIWLMYTGLRKGELLALTWDKVDLKNKRIYIESSVYHKGNSPHIKSTKSETSLGSVPILNALIPYIHPKEKGLVFPDKDGNLLSESRFRDLYDEYKKESGVTCTSHQLRHAYTVMLYEANIPPEEMQILLRHAQLSTTMDIYNEIREEKIKQTFDKVYNVNYVSK